MHIDEKQLQGIIIETGLISRTELEGLVREAKRKGVDLSTYLVTMGRLTALDVRRLEGQLLGISFVDLLSEKIPYSVLSHIPEPIVRAHNIIAFNQEDGVLSVAILSLDSLTHVEFLQKALKVKIKPYFTTYQSIKSAQLQYQKELKKRYGERIAKDVAEIKTKIVSEFRNDRQLVRELQRQSEDTATARLVETLIAHARAHHAQHIHIEPTADTIVIRYRIGGTVHEALLLAKDVLESIVTRMKFLAQLTLTQKDTVQHGTFTIENLHEKIVGKVSVIPTAHGEKLSIRLTQGGNGLTLENIGFHGVGLEVIERTLHAQKNAILVTGPRGSGVTTILYALLNTLHTPQLQTVTIEGALETTLPRATQLLTRPELGFDTHTGVKAALSSDADVVMVSELSTAAVATTVLHSARLGRMILAGVRTTGVAQALVDLVSIGVKPELIAQSVALVIGTRLIPALNQEKERYFLEKREIKALGKLINLDIVLQILKDEQVVKNTATWETIPFYRAKSKKPTLEQKVVGVQEVLVISRTVIQALQEGVTGVKLEQLVQKEGQLSLLEDGIFKAVRGDVALEDVLRHVSR